MTFGGNINIKQRVSLWAAIAFFAVSTVFGFQYLVSGHLGDRGIAILALVLGVFAVVGIWTMGLAKRPATAEDDEWQDTIK
jgi:hypothetical protein